MTNFLYAMLLILSGSAIGAALFGAFATIRISMIAGRKKILNYATILLVGTAITQGVLLTALIKAGTARESAEAWFYIFGLVIQSTGLIGAAKVAIDKLASVETPETAE